MSNGVYIGMNGAVARSRTLEGIADELANATTPGFLKERGAFEAFLPEKGGGEKIGVGAVQETVDARPGAAMHTGDKLDVRPEGEAFLAVRLPTGAMGLTRDGRLRVAEDGSVYAAGLPLLADDGHELRISLGAEASIRSDGVLLSDGEPVGRIARFASDGQLHKVTPGVVVPADPAGVVASDAKLHVGQLTASNASPLEAAVALVTAQRIFDASMQAIETYKKLGDRAGELGRIR